MDWVILILLVPAVLVPIVLLCGFVGCKSFDEEIAAVPDPPLGLTATRVGLDQIDLAWLDKSGGTATFLIERDGTPLKTVNGTKHEDKGLDDGTTFHYAVKAVIGSNVSAPSNQAAATTKPKAPSDLQVTNPRDVDQIEIDWKNDSKAKKIDFRLQFRPFPGGAAFSDRPAVAKTKDTHPNLTEDTEFEYRVVAFVTGIENGAMKEVVSDPSVAIRGKTLKWRPIFNATLGPDSRDRLGDCLVQRISAAALTPKHDGIWVRITMRGVVNQSTHLTAIHISRGRTGGNPWDSAADLTEVRFGGASGAISPQNGDPVVSDKTKYTLDADQDLIIAVNVKSDSKALRRGAKPGVQRFAKDNAAEAGTQVRSPAGYTPPENGFVYCIEKIEVA
jgi:hypothetical protein